MHAAITTIVRPAVNGCHDVEYVAPLAHLDADSVNLVLHHDIATINADGCSTIVLSHDQARQLRELLNHADVVKLLD